MRTRRRSSGVGSGWSGVGGSESDVTGSAAQERARGGRSGDGRETLMATGEANDPLGDDGPRAEDLRQRLGRRPKVHGRPRAE